MGRVRIAIAVMVVGAAIAAQSAVAQTTTPEPPPPPTTTPPEPPPTLPPVPITAAPPKYIPKPKPKPAPTPAPKKDPNPAKPSPEGNEKGAAENGGTAMPPPATPLPTACGPVAVPAYLIPIYSAASQAYDLGPAGPSILAAINEIESGFGQNLGPSSAGAVGWMQFMPSTWSAYGVDADSDGDKDPNEPHDAIFPRAPSSRTTTPTGTSPR